MEQLKISFAAFCLWQQKNETFLLMDTFFMTYAARDFHDRIAAYASNNEALNFDKFLFIEYPGV